MSEIKVPQERLWTPANIVTLLRICGVPLFVIALLSPWPTWFPQWTEAELWKPWVAALAFIILAATDGLDGYLARSRGEVTNLGKFMDPLADKILTTAALLALIELNVVPSWPVLIILCREFIVAGIRMVAANQNVVIAASWYGKAKTVTQIIAIVLFLIKDSHMVSDFSAVLSDRLYLVSWAVMLVALILTIVSMLDYFAKAKELLSFSSAKSHEADPGRSASMASDVTGEATCVPPRSLEEETLAHITSAALDALATEVLAAARRRGRTIALAESLTGGLIAATLTAQPGSSDVVAGAIVSYTNEVKHIRLGVSRETLATHGAVSEQCATEMAIGARKNLGSDIALSVTGIAGPRGAEAGKPVGTVWFGLADAQIRYATNRHFDGDRQQVRLQTVRFALELMLRVLSDPPQE
ncbi:MAG: CDP-diacylglycerol--glycerol-3-phosphate 3-phosphatidyltransferase [Raoultibacter sp.]